MMDCFMLHVDKVPCIFISLSVADQESRLGLSVNPPRIRDTQCSTLRCQRWCFALINAANAHIHPCSFA